MATLPQFQSDDRVFQMFQSQWASNINPVINNPTNQGILLKNVSLTAAGPNMVNHLLGRKLIGWKIVRQRAAASVYDTQDANPSPELTLSLVTSANVSVDLEVY